MKPETNWRPTSVEIILLDQNPVVHLRPDAPRPARHRAVGRGALPAPAAGTARTLLGRGAAQPGDRVQPAGVDAGVGRVRRGDRGRAEAAGQPGPVSAVQVAARVYAAAR